MGIIRFRVAPSEVWDDWPEYTQAYLSTADGRITPTRAERDGDCLVCRRTSSESCKLNVALPLDTWGRIALQTATLPERDEPYNLLLELARGKLVQVRNQSCSWEIAGLTIPADVTEKIAEAQRWFARSAASQDAPNECSHYGQLSLLAALEAGEWLARVYAQHAIQSRLARFGHLPLSWGCGLSRVPPTIQHDLYRAAFDTVTIPITWALIEPQEGHYLWQECDAVLQWAEQQRLLVRGGPLLDLGPRGLPEWLARWKDDPFNLQSFVCDFVETAISRYQGHIRWWDFVMRFHTGGAFDLPEQLRMELVGRALEVAQQTDVEAQYMLRVDCPWGEYLAAGQHRLTPLQCVDYMLRSGVQLAAINLEFAVGFHPHSSALRDLLDISRLIDQWSQLGIPLFVSMAAPSGYETDPLAHPDWTVKAGLWGKVHPLEAQAHWLRRILPVLMAKPNVIGISWTHFFDGIPHRYPHAGLLAPDGVPKPALESLLQLRTPSAPTAADEDTVTQI